MVGIALPVGVGLATDDDVPRFPGLLQLPPCRTGGAVPWPGAIRRRRVRFVSRMSPIVLGASLVPRRRLMPVLRQGVVGTLATVKDSCGIHFLLGLFGRLLVF